MLSSLSQKFILTLVLVAIVIQSIQSEKNGNDIKLPEDLFQKLKLIRNKRGFGCGGPFSKNERECHNHCKTIPGVSSEIKMILVQTQNFLKFQYKGGYCDAKKGWFVCKCY